MLPESLSDRLACLAHVLAFAFSALYEVHHFGCATICCALCQVSSFANPASDLVGADQSPPEGAIVMLASGGVDLHTDVLIVFNVGQFGDLAIYLATVFTVCRSGRSELSPDQPVGKIGV